MSLHAFPSPAVTPYVEAARDALADAGSVGLAVVGDDDLQATIIVATEVARRAEALRLEAVAEADRRRLADEAAATGTDAWAAALTGDRREVLAGGLRIAALLQEKYAATREAFAAGRIGLPQVKVIVDAAEQSPVEATPEQIRLAEEHLLAKATGDANRAGRAMDSGRLRRAARRLFAPIDKELADKHEAIMLGREHRNAEATTHLRLDDNGDGTWSGRFTIPDLYGQILRAALERLTAPRRLARDRHGKARVDESAPGHDNGLNLHEKYGLAFCELLEHLGELKGYGADVATLIVTVALEHLRDGLGAAGLDTGAAVSAGEARRLACNAAIVPGVMGGASLPLDLGRTRRLHSTAQRLALRVVHDSCAISTCRRPFDWCEIHHADPWSRGGDTDLATAVPLCAHHHRRAHDVRFELARDPDDPVRWILRPVAASSRRAS